MSLIDTLGHYLNEDIKEKGQKLTNEIRRLIDLGLLDTQIIESFD